MKIDAKYLIFVAMFPLFSACTPSPAPSKTSAQADTTSNNPATYTPDVESLSRHQAAPEWYPRWMHFGLKESDWNGKRRGYLIDALDWHSERFGHPSEFGDHNMVPLFTAEHFDAEEWGKDVILTHKHEDTPASFSVLDLEKGRQAALSSDPWLTDDTISKGSWSYTKDHQIKSDIDVTHALIDTVAKNGQLLLNVSPRYDGTIPDNQRAVLETRGNWLDVNGEAIYGTRP